MQRKILGLAAALTLVGAISGAGAAEPPRSNASAVGAQLQPVADHFAAAWNLHDPKALAASFTEDAVVINPMGRQARGRVQIEALFTDEHQHHMKGTNMTARVVDVRMLSPSLAFVDEDFVITGMREPTGRVLPDRQLHGAMLMQKENGTWRVAEARPYEFSPTPPEEKGIGGSGAPSSSPSPAPTPMSRPRPLQK